MRVQPRTSYLFKGKDGVWRGAATNFIGDAEKPPGDYYDLPVRFGLVEIGDVTTRRAVRVDETGNYGWIAA